MTSNKSRRRSEGRHICLYRQSQPFNEPRTDRAGDRIAAGLRLCLGPLCFFRLGRCCRAVGIECARQLRRNGRRRRALDRRALHQVHQLAVAQDCNRGRGRRMSLEVAARALGGTALRVSQTPSKRGEVCCDRSRMSTIEWGSKKPTVFKERVCTQS